jgi:DNA-binding CsgD family transcriptional regulator
MRSNWEMWLEMSAQRFTGKRLDEVQDLHRYMMRCCDQRNLVAELEASQPVEDWRLAGNVQCPVLVIYRENALATQDEMTNLAHQLPQGRLIYLSEEAASPLFGSRSDLYLQALEEFLGPPLREDPVPLADASQLTPRERDVLALLARGHTEAEIAQSLCIARPTVSRHVQNLYGKLGVHRRGEAVAWAVRNGIG